MSLAKAIRFLTYSAPLLLGCQERDGSGETSQPVEAADRPPAATLDTAERTTAISEQPSHSQAVLPRPIAESRYPDGPDRPKPTIQLEPMDMMTAIGSSPLHVLVSRLGTAADAGDVLERVAAAVALRTWPEFEEVPTTVSKSIEASGSNEHAGYGHVHLQPTTPLTDRWYALVLESVPSGVELPAFASVHETDSGKHVARFRVGSQPVVTGLRVYEKEGQKHVVYVDFSERVVGDAQSVVVTGRSFRCQGTPPPAAAKATGFPAKGDGAGEVAPAEGDVSTTSLQLTCSGRVDVKDELTLEIKSGFRSASGPSLNAGKAIQLKAASSDWSDWGGSGKKLRVALPSVPLVR
jgi:hypothetical protein